MKKYKIYYFNNSVGFSELSNSTIQGKDLPETEIKNAIQQHIMKGSVSRLDPLFIPMVSAKI